MPYSHEDLIEIESIVRDNNSFVALADGDIFNLLEYLKPFQKLKFRAICDLNFSSRIAELTSTNPISNKNKIPLRRAAAVMAFCHIAQIDFYGDTSMIEFASINGGEEAQRKCASFSRINNLPTQPLIDFALGRSDVIPGAIMVSVPNPRGIPSPVELSRTISSFQLSYILVMKIAILSKEQIEPWQKVIKLMDWMNHEFIFSGSGLIYANLYFSPSGHKAMIKGASENLLRNAAWDISLLVEWSRIAIQGAGTGQPLLLITGDKAIKDVAMRLTASSLVEFRNHIAGPWGKKRPDGKRIFEHYQNTLALIGNRPLKSYAELNRIKKSLSFELFGENPPDILP